MKSEMFNSLLLKMKNHRRKGKLIAILALVLVMGTASAQVFTMYYGHSTATVQNADVTLALGWDITSGPVGTYPSATGTLSAKADYATIGISMFATDATLSPTPATYFTDLLRIHNGGGSAHSVSHILISNIDNTDLALGQITVYLCATQNDNPAGAGNSIAHFDVTPATAAAGGDILGVVGAQNIAASGNLYIEVVAYAASGAAATDGVTFDIAIQWV